jgi:hypothetical protein
MPEARAPDEFCNMITRPRAGPTVPRCRNPRQMRQTGQRLTSIMIPPLMGEIADRWGVSESFFILGAFMLLLCHRSR